MHQRNMICGLKSHPHLNPQGQYEFWRNPYYKKYIQNYGYHFNEHTLDVALNNMINRDGTTLPKWRKEDVSNYMKVNKIPLINGYTLCDATYLANMFYADYYENGLSTTDECFKMAHNFMADPDGYEGKIFGYWLNDIMFKGCVIDWEKML